MPPVKTVKNDTDVIVPKAGETYVSEDGTVSQVLDDHIDANYEPTEEEVMEFADWIGMKLPEDSEFLWLAREGLKAPLPKEWKPCSTNDGEVYYFNFKTGESSWDHPMDSVFRQRFEQEKEKARKAGKSTPGPAATKAATTTAQTTNLSRGGIPQTRVIMTDTGVTRREPGMLSPSPATTVTTTTTAPTTSTITNTTADPSGGSRGAAEKVAKKDRPTIQTARDTQGSASTSSRASPLAGSVNSAGFGGGGTANKDTPQPTSSLASSSAAAASFATATPRRIVSETERAMEEKVQREVQRTFETEKTKLAEAHQSTLASLQQLYEKDMAEMRASDEARRVAATKQEDEERDRCLQQTREKCEEQYGEKLRTMEREEETLKSKLQKMEAEAARAASGNTQRAQIEEQMRNALAKQRADLEAITKRQHDADTAAEETAHKAALQKIARDGQEKVNASQQAAQRKLDDAERALALQAETQKKKLESQLKDLEQQLAEKTKASADSSAVKGSATTTAEPSHALSEELARISAAKAAQLREVEQAARKEREAAQAQGEAALAEVTRQLRQPLSPGGPQGTQASRAPSFSGDRPMSVMVLGGSGGGGSFAGSRPTSATLSVAYTQELNRIRMTRAKERQERLSQLRVERDAAIAAVSATPGCSLGASGHAGSSSRSDSDASLTLEELKAAHTVELEAKKTLYSRLEADLKAQLAQEVSSAAAATTAEQQSAVVAKAVDAEMELYVQEVQARYARMQLEADAKREKLLADHQLALEAYERKKSEMESRQAREEQEAKEAFIQEKVDAAVKAESAKLEAEHATAMARLTARYEEERGAAKGEVDEEMDAYEQVERRKIAGAAAAAIAAAAPPLVSAANTDTGAATAAAAAAAAGTTAAIDAQCGQVSQQLAEREARWSAEKDALVAQRQAAEAQRTALLAQHQHLQQRLKALKEENARLAASVATAAAQRDGARKTASVSPPEAPPSGYRWRTEHEATMRAIEDSYRTEQSALEADSMAWRTKTQQLLQQRQQQGRRVAQPSTATAGNPATGGAGCFAGTGLNTPRQQILSSPSTTNPPAAAVASSALRTPMLSHASPIAPTVAGASLQNTPVFSFPFGDSSLLQQPASLPTSFATTTTQPPLSGVTGPPLCGGGVAAASRDALSYSREHQQSLLQRQASLQAARDAWQQQRAREAQLQQLQRQQQSSILSSSFPAVSSFSKPDAYISFERGDDRQRRTLTPQRRPSPHPQDQLNLVLSKLSSRLDSLTGQAEKLQLRRSRSEHVDPHHMPNDKTSSSADEASSTMKSRLQAGHSRQQPLSSPQRRASAVKARAQQQQQQSQPSVRALSSAQRRNSGHCEDVNLSSKWNHLLNDFDRK